MISIDLCPVISSSILNDFIYHVQHEETTGKLYVNPLSVKLNPICHLLALLGAHPILHVSRIMVKFRQILFPFAAEITHSV